MNNFRQVELKNGLKIIVEPNRNAASSAVGFFVRTGSTDEQPFEAGLSHFLEHMMFKGTKSYSAIDLGQKMADLGALANAYTSEEITCYFGAMIPENMVSYFDLLCEMVSVPTLDDEEFNMEKNVILEEIALYEDKPLFKLLTDSYVHYFENHPAGLPILGTNNSIKEMKVEWMRDYFKRRYAPNNMTLVLTGACDCDAFIEYATKKCENWQRIDGIEPYTKGFSPVKKSPKQFAKLGLKQRHILFLSDGANRSNDDAWSVLMQIIGIGSGSKIYWDLVHLGLCDEAMIVNDGRSYLGCTYTYASTSEDNYEKVLDKLRHLQSRNYFADFTDQDLINAKTKYASGIVRSGETPMDRLMAIGPDSLCRSSIRGLTEQIESIMAVTRDEIVECIERYKPEVYQEFTLIGE